jgi:hypothetical protein
LPKEKMDEYRRCTLIDPLEALCFLSLAILIAEKIEPQRLPSSFHRVFSYRYEPKDSHLFDLKFNSEAFQNHTIARLADDGKAYLVRTDIKDFYASITGSALRNALSRHRVPHWCIETLMLMLGRWQQGSGAGIPIGPNASHILAEALLVDVDSDLIKDGIDYIRFVDDYRLFAPDADTARTWLEILSKRLRALGLILRADKTSVDAVNRSNYVSLLTERNIGPLAETSKPKPPQPPPCPPSGCRRPPPRLADINGLKLVDAKDLFERLRAAKSADMRDLRLLIESSYHRSEFEIIERAIDLLDQSPHFILYLTDFLTQESSRIPPASRASISQSFGVRLNRGETLLDYEILKIATLLGTNGYRNPDAIVTYFRSMPSDVSPIVTRYLLEALDGQVDALAGSLFRERYDSAGPWERRAIAKLMPRHMRREYHSALHQRGRKHRQWDPFLESVLTSGGSTAPF